MSQPCFALVFFHFLHKRKVEKETKSSQERNCVSRKSIENQFMSCQTITLKQKEKDTTNRKATPVDYKPGEKTEKPRQSTLPLKFQVSLLKRITLFRLPWPCPFCRAVVTAMSVCLSFCLSICLSVSVSQSVCLAVCLSVSVCLSRFWIFLNCLKIARFWACATPCHQAFFFFT